MTEKLGVQSFMPFRPTLLVFARNRLTFSDWLTLHRIYPGTHIKYVVNVEDCKGWVGSQLFFVELYGCHLHYNWDKFLKANVVKILLMQGFKELSVVEALGLLRKVQEGYSEEG